jgi:ribosomal protein S18 acetylase RimI-like enzyme
MIVKQNRSLISDIEYNLINSDRLFLDELIKVTDFKDYCTKLFTLSNRLEIWNKQDLIGLLAYYQDETANNFFISNLSVCLNFQRRGIGGTLMKRLEIEAIRHSVRTIDLEVLNNNSKAIAFYLSLHYNNISQNEKTFRMRKIL